MMFLCSQVSDKEWSGILFYKSVGDVSNLAEFKVIAEEIFLKDIGTSGYTSYETTTEDTDFMMSHLHLLESEKGKIHSHNHMSVFHSGTDWDDLWDNSETHNYYLSFIVNNRGDVQVYIAWRAQETSTTETNFHIKDHNGNLIPQAAIKTITRDLLVTAEGVITVEKEMPDNEFIERYNEVVRQHNEKPPVVTKYANGGAGSEWGNFQGSKNGAGKVNAKNFKPETTYTEDRQFLARFISMGNITNLDTAINKVTALCAKDFTAWKENILNDIYWEECYGLEHNGSFLNEEQDIATYKTIMKGYKLSNPDVHRYVLDALDNALALTTVEEEADDETMDLTQLTDAQIEMFNKIK